MISSITCDNTDVGSCHSEASVSVANWTMKGGDGERERRAVWSNIQCGT